MSIRNLDDDVRDRLRVRAARNGRSMEQEARCILADAVRDDEASSDGLFPSLLDRFSELGGADLELPPRVAAPRAAGFGS